MTEEKIFVGREAELEQFKEVLKNPKGQAVLVVGQAGMGKTWLVNEMAEIAENHPELKCGWVRYEVPQTDSVDSTMELMMDNAFEAASTEPGSFDKVPQRRKQWMALLKTVVPKGGEIAELIESLRRDQQRNTREQFLKRLELVSERLPDIGRAIFVIDPEKYMQADSDQSWAIVVKELPEKIKFIFAQRPEDALVESETIDELDNVVRIPEKRLGVLEKNAIDKLLKSRAKEVGYTAKQLDKALSRYNGHPYALGAALDLLEAGIGLAELPKKTKPTKFAEVQWRRVCGSGDGAIELFEAYALLEVGVPDDVVEAVSCLKSSKRRKLLADKYLAGLLRKEGEGKRIYHAILADYILGQMGEAEKNQYHSRAVGVYRRKLARAEKEQIRPDTLAAMRLAEHVLAAEGKVAFVYAFVDDCTRPLLNLGLLDTAISLSERSLGMIKKGSEEEAMVTGNLGAIYYTRGELDKAEEMHLKSLKIKEKLGLQEGISNSYGNLGLIYQTRGELDKAEEMLKKALEIDKKIGRLEGEAIRYSNLGLIYQTRGDLDKAEQMLYKSLEINEKLGRLEGIARQYGNLGNVYYTRGDLDKAEEMHKKSLEIAEKLGLQEIMASDYGNLGLIYRIQGDLDKTEKMHKKALEIDEKLGMQEGMAANYANLGLIYMDKGELDRAEEMYRKSLEIEKKLGRLEGMAIDYVNLGLIYKQRGDIGKAKEYWEKALELYKRIGIPHEVEEVERWIRDTD